MIQSTKIDVLIKIPHKDVFGGILYEKKMQITKYVALWFRRGKKISELKPRFCF